MGRKTQHNLHGAPDRFETVAAFIYDTYGLTVRYIADVAGGQGLLSRTLNKQYNYSAEVVDPRGWTVRGVESRATDYNAGLAVYYDLIVGLHPDEATRSVAESALVRPVILIPCCNFWNRAEKLGRDALVNAIEIFYNENGVSYERVEFDFRGPKNIGLVSQPPRRTFTSPSNSPDFP